MCTPPTPPFTGSYKLVMSEESKVSQALVKSGYIGVTHGRTKTNGFGD